MRATCHVVVEILYKPSKVPGCGLSQLLPVDINEQTDKSMCVGGEHYSENGVEMGGWCVMSTCTLTLNPVFLIRMQGELKGCFCIS